MQLLLRARLSSEFLYPTDISIVRILTIHFELHDSVLTLDTLATPLAVDEQHCGGNCAYTMVSNYSSILEIDVKNS